MTDKPKAAARKPRNTGAIRIAQEVPDAADGPQAFVFWPDEYDSLADAEKTIRDGGSPDGVYAVVRVVSRHRVEVEAVERRRLVRP